MATTTNYGWTTPDDTALVKDGAAAIRTLGSSVDTTTKNLNPSTTLGDIEYRSSTANTNTRLGIGSTGNVLTVAGGVPSWAAPASGGMTLLSTTTLSGATTTISSISGGYNQLYILISGVKNGTDDIDILLKPNNGNIATSTYTVNSAVSHTNSGAIKLTGDIYMERAAGANAWALTIDNYTSTSYFKPFNYSGRFILVGTTRGINGGGGLETTSAITSLVFSNGGGYSFSDGQVLIYGVK